MKIYTKTGDGGDTSLFSGERVPKYSDRVDVYGTIDEMLAAITLALEFEPESILSIDLNVVREKLFTLSTDFATLTTTNKRDKIKSICEDDVITLEKLIDKYSAELPPLKSLIMPGGSRCAAFINLARTICRRAERVAVKLATTEDVNKFALMYLNRLSDYLFVASRRACTL